MGSEEPGELESAGVATVQEDQGVREGSRGAGVGRSADGSREVRTDVGCSTESEVGTGKVCGSGNRCDLRHGGGRGTPHSLEVRTPCSGVGEARTLPWVRAAGSSCT